MRSRWRSKAYEAGYQAAAAPRTMKRSRQAAWDADHMHTASCRLTTDEMARLRAATRADSITIYGLIRYMISVYLQLSGY